jgi:hypothetical protein
MRTETEIREKLKEIEDEGWLTGEIIMSSSTRTYEKICLLEWVLEEYEYPTKEEINNMIIKEK